VIIVKKVFFLFVSFLFVGSVIFFFLLEPKVEKEEDIEKIQRNGKLENKKEPIKKDKSLPKEAIKKIKKKQVLVVEEESSSKKEDNAQSPVHILEFELDPQYYPSVGGYLKVEGDNIQVLEIFHRETNSFLVSLGFTKVMNSIFQVGESFWNLHKNPEGKSYNVRVGNGPLKGNIITFTPKGEELPISEDGSLMDEEEEQVKEAYDGQGFE
jgi:hypothetical protein